MALDKGILHGKEKRKPYYRSGAFDATCRPHGGCPYCYRNRKGKDLLLEREIIEAMLEEVEEERS
jgi:hypothetical protein